MFVQVIRGVIGDEAAIHAALDRWDSELRPEAIGLLGSTAGVTTDGELVLIARFESEDVARRHSDRPEQAAWWAELEEAFAGPASFFESSAIDLSMGGGSDDAGFVQGVLGSWEPGRRTLGDASGRAHTSEGTARHPRSPVEGLH